MMLVDDLLFLRWRSTVVLGLLLFALGCDSVRGSDPCDEASSITLEAGSCLVFEDEGQLAARRSHIEQVVRQTVASVNGLMPIDKVLIRVVADPAQVIPELGLSGYNPSEEEVVLFLDPQSSVLSQSLTADLALVLAHEMHHAKRRRTVGYGSTLFEAAVSEGLADHFAMEVVGSAPPLWASALTGSELALWISRARETWTDRPYDHRAWFVGAAPDIPRWAGYAIGFEIVRVYLSADPDRRASILVDEPAETFLPDSPAW
ncbi:MAG: DUF2268 domain-containing putative Zn-dependent protease [Rhodothermales bacterium]|nr:DUF2268 domain-containing putative Zn-dependent protease [Rhodothermales bacterium]